MNHRRAARERLRRRCFDEARLPALTNALDGARFLADQSEAAMRRVGRAPGGR